MKLALLSITLIAACGSKQAATGAGSQRIAADLIVVGDPTSIWTNASGDDSRVQSIAIRDGVVIAAGTCTEVFASVEGAREVIEMPPGAQATPGLADAHAHLYGLGKALESIDLRGASSEADAVAKIANQAPPGSGWITGRGWDQNLWKPAEFPSATSLSAAVGDRPVAVRRVDGHALWANRRAMELAGVTASTQSPAGGEIVRDKNGKATGIFIDTAMSLIEDRIPSADPSTIERRILRAANHAVSLGLTAVHEMGISMAVSRVYEALAQSDRLPLRVYGVLAYESGLEEALPVVALTGWFERRAVKMFADGALGSRGAKLLAPYADAPKTSGLVIHTRETIESVGQTLAENGYQLAVHAIGDGGNRNTIDAFEKVIRSHPDKDLRFRVEHAQIVTSDDVARLGKLGIVASMQPTHATSDMPWAEQRLGGKRILDAYAWKKIGAVTTVAFGSDFPVEKPSPLLGIYAATTRQDADGAPKGGWYADQRLTLEDAVFAFTAAPAYAAFAEKRRGVLRPGMDADITIFDGPLRADRSLLDLKIAATIVAGKLVYRDPAQEGNEKTVRPECRP